jgi:hypothetical protein
MVFLTNCRLFSCASHKDSDCVAAISTRCVFVYVFLRDSYFWRDDYDPFDVYVSHNHVSSFLRVRDSLISHVFGHHGLETSTVISSLCRYDAYAHESVWVGHVYLSSDVVFFCDLLSRESSVFPAATLRY